MRWRYAVEASATGTAGTGTGGALRKSFKSQPYLGNDERRSLPPALQQRIRGHCGPHADGSEAGSVERTAPSVWHASDLLEDAANALAGCVRIVAGVLGEQLEDPAGNGAARWRSEDEPDLAQERSEEARRAPDFKAPFAIWHL
jgi:hypothetical protein